ncbi:serine hydrolase domain-containing protein [Amycolatopsis minnesotensis]|uniref:Serine hydrolase domain-containing protein n=1 Tax=Amycolatopsis minnesotensis TaxID=337894 RepID=A0ABP5C8Y0_9PSEU
MSRTSVRRSVTAVLTAAIAGAVLTGGMAEARPAQPDPTHSDTRAVLGRYQAKAGPGAAVYAGDAAGSWHLSAGTAAINGPVRAITPDDHFRIASQTKTFTAAVVMQLVDEGKIELDGPIERYLPGVVDGNGYDGSRITVRQLLQHTAGIPDPNVFAYAQKAAGIVKPDGSVELADLVRVGLQNFPPAFQPGAGLAYSNLGYLINGLLIQQVTGMPVRDAITSRIITPLGLTQTTYPASGDRSLPAPYLPGYTGGRIGPFFFWTETGSAPFLSEPSIEGSAGAVVSTLPDVSKFYRALLDGKVVSAASLAEMQKVQQTPGIPEYRGVGLGLQEIALPCGGVAWFHNGFSPAGWASVTAVTEDGRYASMVTNTMEMAGTRPLAVDVVDTALCDIR